MSEGASGGSPVGWVFFGGQVDESPGVVWWQRRRLGLVGEENRRVGDVDWQEEGERRRREGVRRRNERTNERRRIAPREAEETTRAQGAGKGKGGGKQTSGAECWSAVLQARVQVRVAVGILHEPGLPAWLGGPLG